MLDLNAEWILAEKRAYGPKRRVCALSFLKDVLDHARRHWNDPSEALSYTGNYERAFAVSRLLQEWSVFLALVRFLGDFYIDRGKWKLWQEYSDSALAGPCSDDETLSEIQRCRCRLFFRLNDYDRMEQALDVAEAAAARGHCMRTAAALTYLRGALARKRRDYDLARRYCLESLDRWREFGDQLETAIALYNLGAAEDEDEHGDLAAALRCFEECLRLFRETGHLDRAGRTLVRMARVLHLQGINHGAAACLADAEGLVDPDLQPREWIHLLSVRARVEKGLRRAPRAVSLAHEAVSLARQLGMQTEQRDLESFLFSLGGEQLEEVAS